MRILLAFLTSVALAPVVTATVIVPAEFREIVAGSQLIVVGRVVDVRAEWTDGRRRIDSSVTVTVASTLKGRAGDTVTFLVPGGQIGRYRSVMIGAPVFAPGDEAVLFLNARRDTVPSVFGLHQGVYRVRVDERSGRRMVVSPALLARGESPEVVTRGAAARRPLPLERFTDQVRAVLAELSANGAAR
jgi:hypothetical protein